MMPIQTRPKGWRIVLAGCLLAALSAVVAAQSDDIQAQPNRRLLATADFSLTGLAVKAEPAHQAIPRHTATVIQTRLAGIEGDASVVLSQLDPNLRVRGQLVGPSFRSPVEIEAAIGAPLLVPPLALPGDHLVTNLRVVDTGVAGAPTVAEVLPETCSLSVLDQLLVSQVQVREMTYEEIAASGINVSQDSYSYYNFTLALGTESDGYKITIPVAMPNTPVDPPLAGPPNVHASVGTRVPSPDILPLFLEPEDAAGGGGPELEGGNIRIPGLIIFPGRVALLNQFFEAILIVSNGAPGDTPLVVHTLRARLELPQAPNPANNPLRIAELQVGGAVEELELHTLGPDGTYGTGDDSSRFAPGESGQASFLIEGLKEGLHTIKFQLQGTLDGLPGGPVQVKGEATGAVRVRDASFAVSFTHPGVVRAGQEYDLGITLFNSGSRDILGAFADLSPLRIVGADLADPAQGNQRDFPTTLKPGESGTVIWRLRSRVTGAVTASFTKVEGSTQTCLELVTGVGDRNVPLSPDSLILPDAVRYLPPPVVEASSALLGQAWSIATAPAGTLPEGVLPISKRTVSDRAVELGVAGLRVRFGEPLQVSLVALLRDWLGETRENPDLGFIEALCSTKTGFAWEDRVGEQLGLVLGAQSSGEFHQAIVENELGRSRFLSVLVAHSEANPLVGVRLLDPEGRAVGLAGPQDRFGAVPAGSMLRLETTLDGQARSRGAFLLMQAPASGVWTLELTAWQAGSVDLSILLPVDDDLYRQLSFSGVPLAAGVAYRVRFDPYFSSGAVVEQCTGACSPSGPAGVVSLLSEPPPQLVGVLQVGPAVTEAGDRFGLMAAVLFSKPVSVQTAENSANYAIAGGMLVGSNPPVTVGGLIRVLGAKLNFADRFAFLKMSSPIGPFIERTITLSGITDTRGLALTPSAIDVPIEMTVSPGGVPPGGYLTGRVLNADGTPVPGAPVELWDWPCNAIMPFKVARVTSDNAGRYVIDYIVNGECSPMELAANHPVNGSNKSFTIPVTYHGQHLVADFVFLARGRVEGQITLNGQPVSGAQVQIMSNSESGFAQLAHAGSDGKYLALDIPVGGVSVLAVGGEGQTNATGFGAGWIDGPSKTAIVNVALQSISGSVEGKVLDAAGKPVSRSLVIAQTQVQGLTDTVKLGYSYTATDGAFKLSNLPLGAITIYTTDNVTGLAIAQQIQLTAEVPSVTGVVLTLPGNGSISGRVIDQAGNYLAFAEVQCGLVVVTSDPFGYYRFPMLSAGTQTLTATNPTTGMTAAVQATVWAGQETPGADIVVSAAATVRGTVSIVRTPGLPAVALAGAEVTYDGYHIVRTNSQGAYVLPNVPPGHSFTLRFIDPTKRLGANQPLKLAPGETLTRNVTFHPAAISGKVFQPDGQTGAVARLTVYALLPILTDGYDYGRLSGDSSITTITAGDGSYLIGNLNPGGFRVVAYNDFFPTRVGRIGVLPPDSIVTCNLTLVDTLAGEIKGHVFQTDGVTPVGEGIEVTLGGGHLADAMVRTDATGSFSFPEVFATGIYNLTAADPETGYSNRIRIAVERNKDCVADIRLLGRGSIQAKVIDAAGIAVESGTVTVTGIDYPNASVQVELSAGSGGFALFENLPEGPYSITASRQGLSGRVAAVVSLSGLTTVTVQLQPCGTITGRVLMSDGATPVGLADVRLIIDGRTLGFTVSTDDLEGNEFVFPDVPVGDFKLEAFDNRSTRVGRTAGRIAQHGETVTADIVLVAIGTVRGQVTANNSPVDHAYLTLRSGEFGFSVTTLQATTDASGNFSFPGIPAGKFTVSATHPASALTGSAEGILPGGVEPLPDKIVNIAMEQSAALDGVVLNHEGATVAGAEVTVTIGSRVFRTASRANGVFRLDYAPLGEATIRAQAPSGYDRGQTGPVAISQPGSTVPVEVRFDGVGTVKGDALDSDGVTGLTLGTVTLTNSEWSSAIVLASPVQAGKYEIQGVPAGPFSVRLTVPNRTAVGVANGTLEAAQTLTIPLVLEPAGIVTGRVVRPDGTTPAVGADVTIRVTRPAGGFMTLVAHTNAAGIYRAEQVSLGTIEITVKDYESDGLAAISGLSLTANGQVLDVPQLVLDETPIAVQSVSPTNGSVGVSRSTVVTVTFTEPAKPSTVHGASFKLLKGAVQVSATVTLSADGLVATLTPNSILADNSTFTVVVTTQVSDVVDRKLPAEFRSTFTTPDEIPPVVVSFDPGWMVTKVPLDKVIQVTFSEALDPQQSWAGVVRLFPEGQPTALVPLVMSLGESGLVITAQPSVPLAESTRYWIEVTAQKDLAGNMQPAVRSSFFSTVDQTKPVVNMDSIEGQVLFTTTPRLSVDYQDNFSGIDATSLVLRLDGQDIKASAYVSEYGASYQVPASAPLARGSHTIEAQVSDKVGNQSDLKSASFTIDNVPPQITSFTIAGLPASEGMTVTIFRPSFAATYSDNGGVDAAATKLRLGLEGQPLADAPASVTPWHLTYQPADDLPQGIYLVELEVTDYLGNSTISGPIHLLVDVDVPEITTMAPLTGNQHGGTTLVLTGNRLLHSNGDEPRVWIGGNEAWVTTATAGTPDQVTIVTPPGAPGFAAIQITTDRGTGTLPAAFLYETDSQTPFAVEPDTVLLWHLDEPSQSYWSMKDSGPFNIWPDPYLEGLAVTGRFGLGQSGAVWGYNETGVLNFDTSSFTLDCWFKSSAVTKTYVLVGKQLGSTGYGISLLPSGSLQGWLQDEAGLQWIVETPAGMSLVDDAWHSASLVVDRENHRLAIFVDGLERAFATEPAGFGRVGDDDWTEEYPYTDVAAGEEDYRDTVNTGPWMFPGAVDEVRFSSSAHSADRILQVFLGSQAPLPFSVYGARPTLFMPGSNPEVSLNGYNLSEVQATLIDSSGAVHTAERLSSSATEARVRVTVPASAAPGEAQLQFQSPLGTATLPVRILDRERSLLRPEADTLLLWHLDEPGDGAVTVMDSGPFSLHGKGDSDSLSVPGMFGSARDRGVSGRPLDFSTSSFTVEGWTMDGELYESSLGFGSDYDSRLAADLWDTDWNEWSVIIPPNRYDESRREWTRTVLNDGQWHFVAMSFDRTAGQMKLYFDGRQVGESTVPAGFGALHSNSGITLSYGWDEVRISSTAHTSEKIWQDFVGEHTYEVAAVSPLLIQRATGSALAQDLVIHGFDLGQVTGRLEQGGQPADASVSVSERSYGKAVFRVIVNSGIQLGTAQLVVSSPGSPDKSLDLTVVEQSSFAVDPNTILLYRLDETGNGSTVIADSGPFRLNGTSGGESKAAEGRFEGGREQADITGPRETRLQFDNSSFSVDFWVKTNPVRDKYALVERRGSDWPYYEDISIAILPSGRLQAEVVDLTAVVWQAATQPAKYDPESGWTASAVDDGRWHSVTVVVDRPGGLLSIYLDGTLRASAPAPAAFGSVGRPSGGQVRAGYRTGTSCGSCPIPFPGGLDEIRFSWVARTSAEIWQQFSGMGEPRVTRVLPAAVVRDRLAAGGATSPLTIEGFGLQGLTARLTRSDIPVPTVSVVVSDSTSRSAQVLVSVLPQTMLGPATLVLESGEEEFARLPIDIIEPGPLAREPDTVVLWHLDEIDPGAAQLADSGPFTTQATADPDSGPSDGRFGGGRARANLQADNDFGSADFDGSSFTLECWVKTEPVPRAYMLVGKSNTGGSGPRYKLTLLPDGTLRGWLVDTGSRQWAADAGPVLADAGGNRSLKPIDDNQWHMVTMVVDRLAGLLKLYIDGIERASSAMPAGFLSPATGLALRAGVQDPAVYGTGPVEFPGVLDEIRLSSSAHTPGKAAIDFFGHDAPLVTSFSPAAVARDTVAFPITLHGYGMSGGLVGIDDPTITINSAVAGVAKVDVELTIPAGRPAGSARLTITDPAGRLASGDLMITAPQAFVNSSPTDNEELVLWHLDETAAGAIPMVGSGDPIPTQITATASAASLPATGLFGGGRTLANLVADAGFGSLDPGSNSFTVDCWFKTRPVGRPYNLVGRSGVDAGSPEFALTIFPSGALQANVRDAGNRLWQAEMKTTVYNQSAGTWTTCIVDDNQWHLMTMVVDRTASQLHLYVDGQLRASAAPPAGFTTLRNLNQRVRAGLRNVPLGGVVFPDSDQFPGILDEIRMVRHARTPEEIRGDFGSPLSLPSSSWLKAIGSQANLAAERAEASPHRRKSEPLPEPFENQAESGGETVLLWHLDEPANGAVRIAGAGDAIPDVIGGVACRASFAEAGRFEGGRTSAGIVADADHGALDFGPSSFTVEFWLRTDTVFSTYTLLGRDGPSGEAKDFGISLLPSGRLRAWLYDTSGIEWAVEPDLRVDDSAWRLVTLSVDREAGGLYLLIDDVVAASEPCPAGFGALANQGELLRAGHIDVYGPVTFAGPPEFPGVLDEVRILNYARKPVEAK